MEGRGYSRAVYISFVSSGLTFVMVILHEAVRYVYGSPVMAIDWAANALMVMTSFYIRSHVDEMKFQEAVAGSMPDDRPVNPMRFVNAMPAVMAVSLAAAITIHYHFIAGMILYLVMQALLIYSLSGILPFSMQDFSTGDSRGYYRVIAVIWILMPVAMFCIFIYNGLLSSVVIPYMLVLSAMTMVTYFAGSLKRRPLLFRLAPAAASTLFVTSDILVGYMAFKDPGANCYAAISMTYISAMLLFNITILFLKTGRGEPVVS